MNWTLAYLFFGYLLFFLIAVFGVGWWLKGKRRPKSPFKKSTRLLRAPGESLRLRIQEMDDVFPELMLVAMSGPLLAALLVAWLLIYMKGAEPRSILITFLSLLILLTLAAAWWLIKKALKRADYYLGYYGERVVGEILEPLRAEGWQIYHDVPAQVGKMKFNVDHVAIGPGGIFGIETKARRKGNALPGRKDHEVLYDGQKLMWPWADEQPPKGVQNAIDRAKWLEGWLTSATGESIKVNAVLTLPEWFVKETGVDPRLRVVASSWLPDVLKARRGVLTDKQIDLLARQLEQRCRDVEY
ncbi:MAG: nuclease-related domain-containing protein [Lacunisphaera sp.]|nr:nuclease-related domain-containing protein [Lacunisphaera sp.]